MRRGGIRDKRQQKLWKENHEKLKRLFKTVGSRLLSMTDIQKDWSVIYKHTISRDTLLRHLKFLIKENLIEKEAKKYYWKFEYEKLMLEKLERRLKKGDFWIFRTDDGVIKRFYFPATRRISAYDAELMKFLEPKLREIAASSPKSKMNNEILICFVVTNTKKV